MRENDRRTARSRDQILGCMVGGAVGDNLMGTLFGRSAIPACFTEQLELLPVIEELATDLCTGCIISEYDPFDTPEKKRWAMKYCHHRWTPPCGLCNL